MALSKTRTLDTIMNEVLEEARRDGKLAVIEAHLKRETQEAIQIMLSDLDNKSNYQVALFLDDMSDEQMVTLMTKITFPHLVGVAGVAKLEYLKRLEKFAQNDVQRQLLKAVIAGREV